MSIKANLGKVNLNWNVMKIPRIIFLLFTGPSLEDCYLNLEIFVRCLLSFQLNLVM